MRMTLQDWVLLILLSILWGGSFFFVAVSVQELPPLTVVILRTGLAALVLVPILKVRGDAWPFKGNAVFSFFTLGFFNNMVPFSLLFWAQTVIPSSLVSILNATTPIFSIVVAHIALSDERLQRNKLLGVVFGFLGVVVLLGGDAVDGESIAILGMVACLGAALSYGIAVVYARRFKAMNMSAPQVACGQLAATTLLMLPVVSLLDQPWLLPVPSMPAIASVVGLAVLSTAFAYILYFRIIASAGAVNAALVTLLVPVSAILLGTMVLGERLEGQHYIGMAMIGAGLLALDGRIFQFGHYQTRREQA